MAGWQLDPASTQKKTGEKEAQIQPGWYKFQPRFGGEKKIPFLAMFDACFQQLSVQPGLAQTFFSVPHPGGGGGCSPAGSCWLGGGWVSNGLKNSLFTATRFFQEWSRTHGAKLLEGLFFFSTGALETFSALFHAKGGEQNCLGGSFEDFSSLQVGPHPLPRVRNKLPGCDL